MPGDFEAPDQTPCPKCSAWVDTWDGWCLRHEACGYCAHPAREYVAEGYKCSLCGDVRVEVPRE